MDGVRDAERAVLRQAGRRSGAGPRRAHRRRRRRCRRRRGRPRSSARCRSRRGAGRRGGAPRRARRAGRPGWRVGERVRGLGEHGRGARGDTRNDLGHRDRRVGPQRDDHGPARGAGAAAVGHQREPLRAAAASVTSAPIRRLRSSASGCHWTPSTKRRSGGSTASGSSSSDDQPVTTSPRPRGRRPGGGATSSRARPRPRCARPASRRAGDVVVGAVEGARVARCSWWPWLSGRCCSSVPPRGDVEHLHPAADAEERQIALERAAGQRDLEGVALRDGAAVSGWPARRRWRGRCRRRRRA